jgi:hypothetical protein
VSLHPFPHTSVVGMIGRCILILARRHVFRDIRPYMCTFPACAKLEHLFGSQQEWFEHELEVHRRSWYCNQCNQTFFSVETFKKHLQTAHSDSFSEGFLPTVIERCTRPDESPQECPLCGEMQTFNCLQRHLGSHLQQIALFVLRVSEDSGEEGKSDSVGISEGSERDLSYNSTLSQLSVPESSPPRPPSPSGEVGKSVSVGVSEDNDNTQNRPSAPASSPSRPSSPSWPQSGSEITTDHPRSSNAEFPGTS